MMWRAYEWLSLDKCGSGEESSNGLELHIEGRSVAIILSKACSGWVFFSAP